MPSVTPDYSLEFDGAGGERPLRLRIERGRIEVTAPGRWSVAGWTFAIDQWVSDAEGGEIAVKDAQVTDRIGAAHEVTLRREHPDGAVVVCVIRLYRSTALIACRVGFENGTDHSLRLKRLAPIARAHMLIASPWEHLCFLDGRAGGGETRVRRKQMQCESENNVLATCRAQGQRRSLLVGGLTYADYAKYAKIEADAAAGAFEFGVFGEDPWGRLVEPGETYLPEDWCCFDADTMDPFAALEGYGQAVRTAMAANPTPYDFPTVCGWYASMAKYGAGPFINDTPGLVGEAEAVQRNGLLDYTRVGLRLVPDTYDWTSMRHVNRASYHPSIFSPDRNTAQGWWDDAHWRKYGHFREPYETAKKWGLALTERGAIPIIYVQSGLVSKDYAEANPGHMLRDDISRLEEEFTGTPNVTYDYTDPGFQAHLREVWEGLRQAGVKGVMFDYPHLVWHEGGGFSDPKATTARAYRLMFEFAKQGLGDGSWVDERNVKRQWRHFLDLTVGVVDSQRVWGDTDLVSAEMYERCALRWYKNRVLYGYDTDAKHLHKVTPANRDGQRQMLTMLYVIGGRYLADHSLSWLRGELLHDFSRVFPYHRRAQSARPVDAFQRQGCPRIYDFTVDPNWHQVTLLNDDNARSQLIGVELGEPCAEGGLGLEREADYYAYDFWNDRFLGRFRGNARMEQRLRPGEARMLSIRRVESRPQVLSTNRHVMQGFVDLENVAWDQKATKLEGRAAIVRDEVFRIAIASNGREVAGVSADGAEAWIEGAPWNRETFHVCLSAPRTGSVRWTVCFQSAPALPAVTESGWCDEAIGLGRVSFGVVLHGGRPILTSSDRFTCEQEMTAQGVKLQYHDRDGVLDVHVTIDRDGSRARRFHVAVENKGKEDLRLDSIISFYGWIAGDGRFGLIVPNSKGVGYLGEDERAYVPETGCEYLNSYWTLLVQNPAIAAGFITGQHAVNRFGVARDGDGLAVRAFGETGGVVLPPGRRRAADVLFMMVGGHPLAGMERFADEAAKASAASVWGENFATWCSWYSGWIGRQRQRYLCEWKGGLEQGVLAQIEPIAKLFARRRAATMRVVDDSRELSMGDWDDVTAKMPHGYGQLAGRMRSHGVRPGVWFTPFYVGARSQLAKKHPEFLACDAGKQPFMPGYAGIPGGILDTSSDEAVAHLERICTEWRKRGFDYVMTDFLAAQFLAPTFSDRELTPVEVHRRGLAAIRSGLGREVYWLGCTALVGPCMGLVDGFRISGDSFGGFTRKGGVFAYVQSAYRWFYHRRLWLNDPDSVITRGRWDFAKKEYNRDPHPIAYVRGYLSWMAVAGSAITFGDTFDDDLPQENIDAYSRIMPPLSIAGRPLDLLENDPPYVWGVRVGSNPEHGRLLGVFSYYDEEPVTVTVNLDESWRRIEGYDAQVPVPTGYLAWDFWDQMLIVVHGAQMPVSLSPKTGRLFCLHPLCGRPQVLGTTGHFSMGAHEWPDLYWKPSPTGGCLEGRAQGNGGDPTTVFIHVPDGFRLLEATFGEKVLEAREVGSDVIALDLPTLEVPTKLVVAFKGSVTPITARAVLAGLVATVAVTAKPTAIAEGVQAPAGDDLLDE